MSNENIEKVIYLLTYILGTCREMEKDFTLYEDLQHAKELLPLIQSSAHDALMAIDKE